MREHPIPQDIVGYRFHIVGNMTIKQFAEIGTGVFIAFLIYSTNLVAIIKWPLMGIFAALGAAIAFVPIEERPLDHWLLTFIKVLYKPTKFYWKRQAKIPEAFTFKAHAIATQEPQIDLSPARHQRIKEYMLSVNTPQIDPYDAARQQAISGILSTFDQITVNQNITAGKAKPRLKVRVRSMRSLNPSQSPTETLVDSTTPTSFIEETLTPKGLADTTDYQEQLRQSIELQAPLDVNQVAQDISIPEQLDVQTDGVYAEAQTEQPLTASPVTSGEQVVYVAPTANQQPITPTQAAQFNLELPFPSPPTQPNTVVGMLLTPSNELINDAIVEIKNEAGATVRAVKTNALGQFFVNTPLPEGNYIVQAEHDQMQFTPLSLVTTGAIIAPLEIRSLQ